MANRPNLTKKQTARPTAPVSTFFDNDGNQITSDADIAKAYREMTENGVPQLDDKQVVAIVMSIPGKGDDDDVQAARVDKLQAAAPVMIGADDIAEATLPLSAVATVRQTAYKYGARLDQRALADIERAVDAKEDFDGAPVLVEADLRRIYTAEEIDQWPLPGTGTKKWKDANPSSNAPVDYYKTKDVDGTAITGSFYSDFWFSTASGKRDSDTITAAKTLIEGRPIMSGTPKRFLDMQKLTNTRGLESEIDRAQARITVAVNKLRTAVKLAKQRALVSKLLPNVGVRWANESVGEEFTTEDLEVTAKLRKPLVLYVNKPGGNHTRPRSIGQFLRYNVEEAASKAGTIADLEASVKRAPKKGTGGDTNKEGDKTAMPVNVKQATSTLAVMNQYLDNPQNVTSLVAWLNKDNDEKAANLTTVFEAYAHLHYICGKFQKQYDKLVDDQTKMLEQAAPNVRQGKAH